MVMFASKYRPIHLEVACRPAHVTILYWFKIVCHVAGPWTRTGGQPYKSGGKCAVVISRYCKELFEQMANAT